MESLDGLPLKSHYVINFSPNANPLAYRVVVMAGDVGHDGFTRLQTQGVQKL
jgi:hypothetical protein